MWLLTCRLQVFQDLESHDGSRAPPVWLLIAFSADCLSLNSLYRVTPAEIPKQQQIIPKYKTIMKVLMVLALVFGPGWAIEQVPIGLSVWDSYSDVFTAMQYALEKHTNDTSKMFQFKVYADRIRTIDAYKVK